MNIISLVFLVAVAATIVVAVLTRKSIRWFRIVFISGELPAQAANCALINICLILTWITVLQACVDVVKGDSLSGLLGVFAFFVGLATLLFKRLWSQSIVESA